MDKQTLSNYGWLVIVTLILAVMLALATPFGTYVGDAVVSVANGFVGASDAAIDEDNIGKVEDQWDSKFDYSGFGNGTQTKKEPFTTLTAKTWTGLTNLNGDNIWTDGTNTYYSSDSIQYVLNGNTWEPKTWNGLTNFYGNNVWTDGTNTYYSNDDADCGSAGDYILNGNTWEEKTWNGLTNFYGNDVWTDGINTYYSNYSKQYVLKGNTWEPKTWNGLTSFFDVNHIWTDGTNTYYSNGSAQYVFS